MSIPGGFIDTAFCANTGKVAPKYNAAIQVVTFPELVANAVIINAQVGRITSLTKCKRSI